MREEKIHTYRAVPQGERYPEDAIEFTSSWPPVEGEWVADDFGEYYWDNCDGWEASWPLTVTIYYDDEPIGTFDIEMEAVPQFHSRKQP